MSHEVTVTKEIPFRFPFSHKELAYIVATTLKTARIRKKTSISFIITSDKQMQKLNKEYRGKNKPTDVLSFPLEALYPAPKPEPLGDIFLGPVYIAQKMKEYGEPLRKMYAVLCIHGVLHLLGYDHINDDDFAVMQALEHRVYAQVFPKLKIAL